MLADRGYDADQNIAYIEDEMHAVATIPPKKNRLEPRDCDYAAYRDRHLIECLICKLKYFRRIFSRIDMYARRFLAFIHFACTFLCLK